MQIRDQYAASVPKSLSPISGPKLRSAQVFGLIGFAWVQLDALFNYFAKTLVGHLLPINAATVMFLIIIFFFWGWRSFMPPVSYVVAIVSGSIGFITGAMIVIDIGPYRLVEIAGGISTFLIGHFCLRWNENEQTFARMILTVSALYVVVSVIALIQIWPSWFPIISTPWAHHGRIILRPEIMTDQNFQVFYLFPVLILLALPWRLTRFIITLSIATCGLYILSKIQTRSGTLVYLGTFSLCFLAPLFNRSLGRVKVVLGPILIIMIVLLNLEVILDSSSPLISRFIETEYDTGYVRLKSFIYLFEHVWNPLWWIARGYAEFTKKFGTIPHSNATAMFLEGGILGLYMWLAVFLFPVISLTWLFLNKKVDNLATIILLAGVTILVIQLSLNVVFFKQPWLWSGAVAGTLVRMRVAQAQLQSESINSAPAIPCAEQIKAGLPEV